MKEGLLEKIKSRGYWRFNFQPLTAIIRLEHLKDCEDVVKNNSINLRGWDFPHIPLRQDEDGSIHRFGEYIEAWENWSHYKEFWRMYKSGQFLCYRALIEDWFEENYLNPSWSERIQSGKFLGVLFSVVYELTEAFLFLSRLMQNDLYKEGVNIDISLNRLKNRSLWLEDNNRIPFAYPRTASIDKFHYSQKYSKDDVINKTKQLASDVIRQLFENFNWDYSENLVTAEQEKLLSGKAL